MSYRVVSLGLVLATLAAACGASSANVPPPQPAPGYAPPPGGAAPGYAQPQAAPAPGYAQPQAAPAPGYAQPQAAPAPGYAQPQGAMSSFVIVNESAEPICYVNFSPSTDQSWGPDRLGREEIIRPGTRRSWQLPAGRYDFRLQDCRRQTMLVREGVNFPANDSIVFPFRGREGGGAAPRATPAPSVAPTPPAAPAPAAGRSQLVIVNESAVPLCVVRISPSSSTDWGPDRLGSNEMIQPGARRGWSMRPDYYDVRIEDCNGRELLKRMRVPVQGQGVALRVH